MRTCPVCEDLGRERRMKDELRHLHELHAGTAFRFPMTGQVSRISEIGSGRVEIEDPREAEEVEFETRGGDRVTFVRERSGTQSCSPTAEVEPFGMAAVEDGGGAS